MGVKGLVRVTRKIRYCKCCQSVWSNESSVGTHSENKSYHIQKTNRQKCGRGTGWGE